MNEFNECVHEVFSAAGDIIIKSMMGGYLVYLNGKLIGDICANELFLKRTPTSDRLLADSELRYPYEGSKTLMHVFDSFDDALDTEISQFMRESDQTARTLIDYYLRKHADAQIRRLMW